MWHSVPTALLRTDKSPPRLNFLHVNARELTRWSCLQPFFEAMYRAVRPGGMVCTQVGLQSALEQPLIL